MDTRTAEMAGRPTGRMLAVGSNRYAILAEDADGCLIEAPAGAVPRGYAEIHEGGQPVASCLIVLAAPEGPRIRCSFKRRTAVRLTPPADFAPGDER